MEKKINNISAEIRYFNEETRAKAEESRTVTFIASTSSKDRHGTVLNQRNWNLENFNNNPIIGYQHNVYGNDMCNAPDPDDQLGSAKAYYETVKKGVDEEQQLMVDVTFEPADINPKAEKIFRKVLHGSLRAVSVGFVPLKDEKGSTGEERDGAYHYFGQELLEVSVVNIPSNPDALKRSMRNSTSNALTYVSKTLGKRYSEIEDMKVRDVLDLLDGRAIQEIVEEEITEEPKEVKKVNNSRMIELELAEKGLKVTQLKNQ
jgi:HK97 family phage prohead protease